MKVSLVLTIYNEQLDLAEVLAKYITDLKQCKTVFEKRVEVKGEAGTKKSKKDDKTEKNEEIKEAEKRVFSYEIIAINDGSDDGTLDILKSSAKLNRNLRIINLDGRWGKQAATNAGMEAATGDVVILADIDILNPIGILQRMIKEYLGGNEIVYAERERFGFDAMRNSLSNGFVRFATGLFGIDGHYTGRMHVMLFSRDVVEVLNALPHKNKLMRTMDTWIGWEIKYIMFASGYNQTEEKEKKKRAVARLKSNGNRPPERSNVREHSASRTYANAFGWLAIATLAMSVFLLFAPINADFFYHLMLWSVSLILSFVSLMFYCRAVLIKRVGIIYDGRFADEIYKIKDTIN